MFGTDMHITCGDLTPMYLRSRYNESDAASEVSWVIVWVKPKGLTQ